MRFPSLDYVPVEEWILSQVKGRSVLHLGCAGDYLGVGQEACLHYQIAKVSGDLYGVELAQSALETVKKWVPEDNNGRIRYFNANVEQLDFLKGKQFEIILAGSIIEHLSNPGLMLENFTSLCKPEGKIIIITPHVFGLLQFLRVAFHRREAVNTQHTCWFSIQTLTELCSRYGLLPVEWHTGYGWRPPRLSWTIQKRIGVPFFRVFPHLGGSLIGVFRPRQKQPD